MMYQIVVSCLLLLPIGVVQAQIWQPQSQCSVSYHHQQRSGMLRYMTFHDHTLSTPNYHQHLYFNPFTQSDEYYTYAQFEGQYRLNRRALVSMSISRHHHWRNEDDGLMVQQHTTDEKAWGAVRLGGHYLLYDSRLFRLHAKWIQAWWLGGQIALPTGRYDHFSATYELEPKMQAATGAWQFCPMLHHYLRYRHWEVSTQVHYLYSLSNRFYYQFGERWQAQHMWRYRRDGQDLAWLMGIGLGYEQRNADVMNLQAIPEDTGGRWFSLLLQSRMSWRAYQVQLQYQLPFAQQLVGRQTQFGGSFHIGLAYLWRGSEE